MVRTSTGARRGVSVSSRQSMRSPFVSLSPCRTAVCSIWGFVQPALGPGAEGIEPDAGQVGHRVSPAEQGEGVMAVGSVVTVERVPGERSPSKCRTSRAVNDRFRVEGGGQIGV